MKTAEEWKLEWIKDKSVYDDVSFEKKLSERIKAIQLDALKEGMRRAAKAVEESVNLYSSVDSGRHYSEQCRKAILTAAEQLNEK